MWGFIEDIQVIIAAGLKEAGWNVADAKQTANQYGEECRKTVEVLDNGSIKPIKPLPVEFYLELQHMFVDDSRWLFILDGYIDGTTVPWDHKNNKPADE